MTDSPFSLARRKAQLLDPEESSYEDAIEVVDAWQNMKRKFKELNKEVEKQILEWVKDNGDIHHPGSKKRYYAGQPSEVKKNTGVDVSTVHKAVLEAVKGDEERYLACLSSNAFKQAEVKTQCGEEVWNKLFNRKKKWKLVPKDWDGKRGKELEFAIEDVLLEYRE